MIDASLSLEAAQGLRGLDLIGYLRAKGWAERPSKIDGISILSKKLGGANKWAEFILPTKTGFADEHRRVADALRALSQIEGQPESAIALDVRRTVKRKPVATNTGFLPGSTSRQRGSSRPLSRHHISLSDAEIEKSAQRLRQNLGLGDDTSFDVVSVIENEMPRIVAGFRLQLLDTNKIQEDAEAYSSILPPRIFVRHDVASRAARGEPHSRLVIAHELAHLILGNETHQAMGNNYSWYSARALRREEEQATRFAAALLMPMHLVGNALDALEVSAKFNVSIEAAKFRMMQIRRLRDPTEFTVQRKLLDAVVRLIAMTGRKFD